MPEVGKYHLGGVLQFHYFFSFCKTLLIILRLLLYLFSLPGDNLRELVIFIFDS